MRTAVIGAGIIGLATATELDRRGHDVVAIDPEPANGASRAAAGMLAAAAEAAWGQDDLLPLARASAALYPAFVATLETAGGRDVGYRMSGTLAVGADAADRAALFELGELQSAHGVPVQRLTGSAARDLEPALGPAVTSAVLAAEDHSIDPRRVTAALREILGERLREERVCHVVRRDGRVTGIRLTTGEEIDADVVIAAAGLGIAGIDGLPALPLRPVWGDILRLRVPVALRPLLTRTVRAQVRGRPVYVVPRDDGTVVLGASVREGGVAGVQAGSVLALLRDAETVLPGISECEIVEMLARPRPATPDALPLLGTVEPGLVISTGYDRHGVLLAPLAARLGADLAEGLPIDPVTAAAVDPLRFSSDVRTRRAFADLTPPAVAELAGAGQKGR
ncbi:glycine oxidase ThiO [Microbacterium bovistercoris]|uniref:glycine oxidase n=1 Tax=Microbacterium bovistercoris TaxID=2293570 RepID=A0A371NSS9_9MICO|nr:glycine oxidase ThiO [Microbacterium bovistercoris]REJ05252.1 glycine oxidase ThiO [Microbacterium bovistercoris]